MNSRKEREKQHAFTQVKTPKERRIRRRRGGGGYDYMDKNNRFHIP